LRIKHVAVTSLVLCTSLAAQAQLALSEGFDDVAGLAAGGWSFVNTSPSPGTNWFQGNSGIFNAASGAPDSYAAANFLGTSALSGPISNWLITPQLLLDPTSTVSLSIRTAGGNFLDRIEVRMSTTGTAPADFGTLVGSYSATTDEGWVTPTWAVNLSAPTPVYIAFRYAIDDVATGGNYLGIDDLAITAVPEPATGLLLGLGMAGLLCHRRLFRRPISA
jgi:PEP-CTERM motif/Cleaved Adhesin Domain